MLSRAIRLTSCAVILMGGLTLSAPAGAQLTGNCVSHRHRGGCLEHKTCCVFVDGEVRACGHRYVRHCELA